MLLENEHLQLTFDEQTGALMSLYCKDTCRQVMAAASNKTGLFSVYHDFSEPYRFKDYWHPEEPEVFCRENASPVDASLRLRGNILTAHITLTPTLKATLTAELDETQVTLTLDLRNAGETTETVLPVFPMLSGICFDDNARMLGMNQSGAVDKIWAYPGGVYGNAADQSAQLGCLFDDKTCLGFYLADESFIGKEILYRKPEISVRWFPEKRLEPGETLSLPAAVIMCYGGSWMKTVKAYGSFFRENFNTAPVPEWLTGVRKSLGIWFEKKGKNNLPNGPSPLALERFEDMDTHFDKIDADYLEYAFHCELSAQKTPIPLNCCGNIRRHTDGWNVVRADLGGAAALRRGVERCHARGKRVTLYVEGLIVPKESDLFKVKPEAETWLAENPDGTNNGPYTAAGFAHMCCGCSEWQDHLADTCARLLRETDADGIRLDSFSFYHWPCYNPFHRHRSPFDSNLWMQALLGKVSAAMKAVKPEAVLATEAMVDFDCIYTQLALDQYYDVNRVAYGTEDVSVFRVLFPQVLNMRFNGGPVLEAAQLLTDASGDVPYHKEWSAALAWMGEIYTQGEPCEVLPECNDDTARCHLLTQGDRAMLVAVKPDLSAEAIQPDKPMKLLTQRKNALYRVVLDFAPAKVLLMDVLTGATEEPIGHYTDGTLVFETDSPWFCLSADE